MEYKFKQRILNRENSDLQERLTEMFYMLSHWGNANQNDSEIPFYACQNSQNVKYK